MVFNIGFQIKRGELSPLVFQPQHLGHFFGSFLAPFASQSLIIGVLDNTIRE